jgi:hypothetical protein
MQGVSPWNNSPDFQSCLENLCECTNMYEYSDTYERVYALIPIRCQAEKRYFCGKSVFIHDATDYFFRFCRNFASARRPTRALFRRRQRELQRETRVLPVCSPLVRNQMCTRIKVGRFDRRRSRRFASIALLCCAAGPSLPFRGNAQAPAESQNASALPGASIVEKIQAAIRRCGADPCAVQIPPGTYDSSAISTWKNLDVTRSRVGILIPSNVEIRGSGEGITTIRVARAAADPPATLFANANPTNRNIRIRNLSVSWADSSPTYNWVSIFICHACDEVELDHLSLEGNPNKLVNLLDSSHVDVHDCTFSLRSTGYGHGDNALSISRFDAAASPGNVVGVVRDNSFTETGDYRTFSMLIVSQSGLFVHSNTFEAHLRPPGNATGIESGQDNTGHLPEYVKISGNIFHGSSIAYGGLNYSEISGNFLDHGDIYVALQSGTTSSLAGLVIANNELHFGSIGLNGLENTATSHCEITGNRVFDGSIGVGSSAIVSDVEVARNTVRYSNNRNGIECNACSLIRDNLVREIGQNGIGDVHAGYLISGTVSDVSDNVYLDDQRNYDTGTVCSVSSPLSVTCLSSGKSRWVMVQGGEWGFGWTNRTLFIDHGDAPIHAFVSRSILELDDVASLPSGTRYHLYKTTFNAFELVGVTIERFANNIAISSNGDYRRAAVQEDGTVRIRYLSGNVLRPYRCWGTCSVDYRSTANSPE